MVSYFWDQNIRVIIGSILNRYDAVPPPPSGKRFPVNRVRVSVVRCAAFSNFVYTTEWREA
jgi:hypothetical protein